LKFNLVVANIPNLVINDYKLHVVVNGMVSFWLISTSVVTLLVWVIGSTQHFKICGFTPPWAEASYLGILTLEVCKDLCVDTSPLGD
jgi:hypothetical protein